jgi:hypothetical protein
MLFALRQPATLLGLVLGYVVGMSALTVVVRRFERVARGGAPWWHSNSWLDPYAAVGAALAGTGWAPRPEVRRGFGSSERRRMWIVAALSILVPGLFAVAGFAGYLALEGRGFLPFFTTTSVLHGSQFIAGPTLQRIVLGFGTENLAMALLSIVPIPPLATGVAAWSTFPRTAGSRRFAYHLLEEQWGIAVVLLLLIVPLAGEQPALLALVNAVGDKIVHAL